MGSSLLAGVYHPLVCLTVALATVLLVRQPLCRIFGPRVAYTIWGLVPLVALGALIPAPAHLPSGIPVQVAILHVPQPVAILHVPQSGSVIGHVDPSRWVIVCWMIGAGLLAWVQWYQQRTFVRRLGIVRHDDTGELVSDAPEIGPVVVGVFPPKIVLPSDFRHRYTLREQALVLAHERMHLIRYDPFANFGVAVVRSLLWFHPLVHLATRAFRIDQELACDAAVLEACPQDWSRYAHAILKTQLGGDAFAVGCRLAPLTASSLKRRIIMLRIPAPTVWRRLLGATIVSIACLISSGFAWVSKPQVQSSASFSKVVSEGDFVINLKADLRSASKKEAVKTNMFDTVKAGKVAEFKVYLDGKTYCITVAPEADTDNNKVIILTVAYGTIAANGKRDLQAEPTIATVENHDAYIQIGDSVKNELSGMIDLVVTRNTQFTHPKESRTMTSFRAKSILTSVTAAGLLAGASAPSQAQVADTCSAPYFVRRIREDTVSSFTPTVVTTRAASSFPTT